MVTPSSGSLLHNIVVFGRLLRGLGLDINPARMIDFVQALGYVDIGHKPDFYYTARSLLVHRQEDLALFDEAFEMFWRKREEGWISFDLASFRQAQSSRRPIVIPPPLHNANANPVPGKDDNVGADESQPVIEAVRTFSAREVLRQKDFGELTGVELDTIKRMIAELAWHLGERLTRRRRPGNGDILDLRRTLRGSLRYGGEIIEWARRKPKVKPRPLVIIADISGSMERYTRLLLHFVYSLSEGLDRKVEAFVFSTRLTRITRQLRGRDVESVLRDVSYTVPDWSGGTRIGAALKTFNYDWARRVLGQGAVVLCISDGWDRGDAELLRAEMVRLQRSCFRLIWLNPLLGSPEYEPLTRGIQAALPFVDDFLPVHNLASLEDLVEHLTHIDRRRHVRRQFAMV